MITLPLLLIVLGIHIFASTRRLGHHYLGTEHLLLGLLREEEGLGGHILREEGVKLEQAREVVKDILATQQKG